jgi:ABC-2 type transport system permease protein
MNKILLIAKREFLTRVQKKTFLLTTIGLPLLIFGLYALIIFFTVKNTKDFKIAVADNANIFKGALKDKDGEIIFSFVNNTSKDSLDKQLKSSKYDAYILVPSSFNIAENKDSLHIVSAKSVGFLTQEKIERRINKVLEENKLLLGLNVSKDKLDSLQHTNEIVFASVTGDTKGSEKSQVSYLVGLISGFLIYIILFIFLDFHFFYECIFKS